MKKNYEQYIFGKKHWVVTAISIGTSLSSILIFGGLGHLIDLQFQTKPIATICGLIISYPIAQLLIAKIIKTILKK